MLSCNQRGKPKLLLNLPEKNWERMMRAETIHLLRECVDLIEGGPISERERVLAAAPEAEILVTGWGSVELSGDDLRRFTELKLIVHTAGSLRYTFPDQDFPLGVRISTANRENARPVAEYSLGLILAGLRGVFGFRDLLRKDGLHAWEALRQRHAEGYAGRVVALVGFGEIAKRLIELLRPFPFRILVVSKFVTPEDEKRFGIRQASLVEAAMAADVLSLHEADLPEFHQMINREVLALMKDYSILINTARGGLVDEAALVECLRHRPMVALLDVLADEESEEPANDNPLLHLPNCFLTPHVAGSLGAEVKRFGDYLVREVSHYCGGEQLENDLNHGCLGQRA
jgi:phosphoglycerate dehydrogenase-like enzyme